MELLVQLQNQRERILAYYELPESELSKTYGPGKWSVRQILHHLADAETVLYDRIRRTISKPHQVLWGFDQDAWSEALDYAHFPLEINKAIFTAVREGVIYLAEKHYEEKGHFPFVHSNTGLKDLKHLFDKVLWHGDRHLEQIERALIRP
ncbi:MAG: DinB family protein [Bacteroidota bacterium]